MAFAQTAPPHPTPSVVYEIRNPAAITEYRTNPALVRAMVDRLVMAVTGQTTVARAWASLVSPNDKIGIKISTAGGELFTTHRDVVNAVVDGLVAAGHARGSIIVWDRDLTGVRAAGYRPGGEGYQMLSIEPRRGYDAKVMFSAAVLGKLIWGDVDYVPQYGESPLITENVNTSHLSHFATILTKEVTKVINIPVMSDSSSTGLAGCLYNMTVPNVDNWRRFSQFGAMGASAMAELYSDPMIKGKVVLNLMDGLIAGYADGPKSHPNYAVHRGVLLASKDAVALDAVALRTIEGLRVPAKLPPIGQLAAHVGIAAEMGVGNADPALIKLRNLSL
ncbi:MAG: DUF362 domain-containing protein [Verrucomicrobiota bacterium]|nr:DUF362 domain-containing protein [Verrucomicrobiota bacterium]